MKSSKDASEGSLELIPGAALPEKTLSNLETFIQYSYLSAMIYIVCVKRRGNVEAEAGLNLEKKDQLFFRIYFQKPVISILKCNNQKNHKKLCTARLKRDLREYL